jgi:hypothetical protein
MYWLEKHNPKKAKYSIFFCIFILCLTFFIIPLAVSYRALQLKEKQLPAQTIYTPHQNPQNSRLKHYEETAE